MLGRLVFPASGDKLDKSAHAKTAPVMLEIAWWYYDAGAEGAPYAISSFTTFPPSTISMGRSPGAISSLSATMPN